MGVRPGWGAGAGVTGTKPPSCPSPFVSEPSDCLADSHCSSRNPDSSILFSPCAPEPFRLPFPLSGRKELHKSVLASPLVVAEQPPKVLGKAAPRKRNIQEQEQNNYFVRALKTNTKWNVQEQERNNDFVRALKANTKWNVQKQMQNNYFVFAFNTSTK